MSVEHKLIKPGFNHADSWATAYRGASIWSYMRFRYHASDVTPFKARIKFGMADIVGLMTFLCLRLRSEKTIVACINRPDVLAFVAQHFKPGSYILFLRGEAAQGNSFFIEAARAVFRMWAHVFLRSERKRILAQLHSFDAHYEWDDSEVNAAIGDYHYNNWLQFFLKGKNVFYTNCIVPRIEKHMGLHASCELQHGIIHKDHLDYAAVPGNVIQNKLLVWNEFWRTRLISEFAYGGEVVSSEFDIASVRGVGSYDVIIYSTVSDEISRKIEACCPKFEVALQLHPRDYFKYSDISSRYLLVRNTFPSCARYVVINDSTLILNCVATGVYFLYLRANSEDLAEIKRRLRDKYAALYLQHFDIVDTVEAALFIVEQLRTRMPPKLSN